MWIEGKCVPRSRIVQCGVCGVEIAFFYQQNFKDLHFSAQCKHHSMIDLVSSGKIQVEPKRLSWI